MFPSVPKENCARIVSGQTHGIHLQRTYDCSFEQSLGLNFESQSTFERPTPRCDFLCNDCLILVRSINEGANPEWLEHRRPGTPPKEGATDDPYLGLLMRCSLCLLFSKLGTGLQPRMGKHKTSPELARGNESIYPYSLDNIMITYDSSYIGERSVQINDFDVRGNAAHANNLCLIEKGRVSPGIIEGWLSNCKETHSSCQANRLSPDGSKIPGDEPVSIHLIDVKKDCLVSSNTSERYVALSYVWGGDQFKWQRKNTAQLFKEGRLKACEKEISNVVKDAMTLVRNLGLTFLWVDALCIRQDDEIEIKNVELEKMSAVYRQSYFTIFALTATDANCPIPGVEPNSRHNIAYPSQTHPGLHLCKRTPRLVDATTKALHTSRGWTFQESVLSRRCLYFCEDQVYFQCQNAIWCEDRKSPLKDDLLLLKPMVHIIGGSLAGGDMATAEMFKVYWMMAHDYMQRNLTDPADVANAFAYVAEELGGGWEFTHAIPENIIDVALMWTHSGRKPIRREISNMPPQSNNAPPTQNAKRLQEPSWSWTGWEGGVNYEFIVKWGGRLASLVPEFLILDRKAIRFADRKFLGQTLLESGDWDEIGIKERRSLILEETTLQLPSGYDAMLVFPAESVSLGFFRLSTSSVIWKPAGQKAFPTPLGQPITRLVGSSDRVCGIIYGWSKEEDNEDRPAELQLIALSMLEHTPKIPYVVQGTCWKDCCSAMVCNSIFDSGYFKSREWAVLNFLVIRRCTGSEDFWERIAVGQMHVDAWRASNPKENLIHLV